MCFLQKEGQGEEMVMFAHIGFGTTQKQNFCKKEIEICTASILVNTVKEKSRQDKRILHCFVTGSMQVKTVLLMKECH